MIENEDENLLVTAVFEDNTRKRYSVARDINAEKMIRVILQDPTIDKPSQNCCIVKDGHILEKDEKISNGQSLDEFSMNIVFNPFLGRPRTSPFNLAALYGFNDDPDDATIVLNEMAIDDLADIFPQFFRGRNHNGEIRFCGFLSVKKFLIGLIIGTVSGPLSLVVLPCYDFDVSGILGLSVGVILWIILFLVIASRHSHTPRRK